MSASLNAELLSRYFDDAPLIHVNGRTFPVQQTFLPDICRLVKSAERQNESLRPMVDQDLLVKLIRHIDLNKPTQGSVLCFLPGWADIKSLHSKLKVFLSSFRVFFSPQLHFVPNRSFTRARKRTGYYPSTLVFPRPSKSGYSTDHLKVFEKLFLLPI